MAAPLCSKAWTANVVAELVVPSLRINSAYGATHTTLRGMPKVRNALPDRLQSLRKRIVSRVLP